jgi:RNA polymerase-associated protein LEO1
MSTKELFGESSDDESVSNKKQVLNEPFNTNAAAAPDQEDSDDDNEFDDGAVVGVKSATLAGDVIVRQVAKPAIRDSDNREDDVVSDTESQGQMNKAALKPTDETAAPPTLQWTVQEYNRPETASFHMTKLPNILGIQTEAFDPDSYAPSTEEHEYGGAVHNLIRWRYKQDASGNKIRYANDKLVRESNTRLVEWDDGSLTLHVGKEEAFEIDQLVTVNTKTNPSDTFAGANGYLYLSQTAQDRNTSNGTPVGTVLECVGRMHSRLTVKPSSLTSEAHKSLTVAVRQQTIKKARVAEFTTQEDPEKLKLEKIKLKLELEKASARKLQHNKRAPRMSREYLEDDNGEYDTTNIKTMKRKAFNDEHYGDDESDEEESDNDIFNKGKRGPRATTKQESSDDEEMELGEEEDDDQVVVQKKPAATNRLAVLDDDDSD